MPGSGKGIWETARIANGKTERSPYASTPYFYQRPRSSRAHRPTVQDLSPRQLEVLSRAIEEGYYDSPRSCNIEELAELDSANTSTVGEHLRRSEAKILKAVAPMLDRPKELGARTN